MAQTVQEIGQQLVDYCRKNETGKCLDTLYADNAVSVEAMDNPDGGSRITEGLDGIRGKHEWWDSNFTVHSASVDGPYPHGDDRFGVIFQMDAEMKQTGERTEMKELGIYHVKDGKIVREEFFYGQ